MKNAASARYLLSLVILILPLLIYAQGAFTKITDDPAGNFSGGTSGVYKGAAWVDLDGDNWPDLYVAPKFLFHNDQNGHFSQLASLPSPAGQQTFSGVSWGDIDNDGDPDAITAQAKCGVFRNNYPGDFVSILSNLLPSTFRAWDCVLADVNNDGKLDPLWLNVHSDSPCLFYVAKPDSGYTKMNGNEFTTGVGPFTSPTWSDYDLDGDVDLFIATGPALGPTGLDYCYRNMLKETGSFSLQRITSAPFNQLQDGQCYNFIDYDNDGDLDAVLSNYNAAPTRFWRNDGPNGYTPLQTPFTLPAPYHLSNAWGDVDNDGDLDAFFVNDNEAKLFLYRNNGAGGFEPAKAAGIPDNLIIGVALADYDNDGDLDVYANGPVNGRSLFRNDGLAGTNHWAEMTLKGTASNRSAIGAQVRVRAVINGVPVWQFREVQGHTSFQSQNDLRVHVGLGNAAAIDSIEVRWPSGQVQVFAGLDRDKFYKIVEGQGISIVSATVAPASHIRFGIAPNPFTDRFTVKIPEGVKPALFLPKLYDASGKPVPFRVSDGKDEVSISPIGGLEPGSYYLQFSVNGETVTQPLIKQ